jgi:diguanylate cyclase (GGDEF)-like protein/PAS domain S-box-containing protein
VAGLARSVPHLHLPRLRSLAHRIREALPRGRLLSEEEWKRRHHWITALVWLHAVGIAAFGLFRNYGLVHSLLEAAIVVVPASVATAGRARGTRTSAASIGLLLSSAVIVHLSGGVVEAHFHFFVVIGVLTIYQDWTPFLLAIGFVVVHHAVLGTLAPTSVFNHLSAQESPAAWALLHGAFVLASSCAYLVAWRMNERARGEAEESYRLLRNSEERFRSLVSNAMDAVSVVDAQGRVTYESPSVTAVLGYAPQELLGTNSLEIVHPEDLSRAQQILGEVAATPGGTGAAELRVQAVDGRWLWVDVRVTNLLDDPNVNGIVANFRDVSERKQLEDKLAAQAFHDPLTGLANRLLLVDRVGLALERAVRHHRPLALLFIDLDNFKGINDGLGHELGDQVLRQVGDRFLQILRSVDTASRLGGDEFAILLEETSLEAAIQVAQRILADFEAPLRLEGHEIYVNTSIGISSTDEGKETASELLRNADLAMYVAKSNGKGTFAVFEPSMYSDTLETMSLKTDMRKGLQEDEFINFYQPIFSLEGAILEGFEALVRWDHPARGLLSPAEFIPIAEESGLIVELGKQLMSKACARAQRWRETFSPDLKININLSAKQLRDGDLVPTVLSVLEQSGLPTQNLVLELTENLLMHELEGTLSRIDALRAAGIRIAIDDFGTGQSSLALLRRLPVDILKIDRMFVQSMTAGSNDVTFVQAILNLSRSLKLRTVAEGVETQEQVALLRELGCPSVQGYLFGKPAGTEDTEMFLASRYGEEERSLGLGVASQRVRASFL